MSRNPKVVLIGLKATQERILTEEFPNMRFIFMKTERKSLELPKAMLYVVWAKFINHSLSEAVVKRATSSVFIHHGGMKELKTFLQNWNCENDEQGDNPSKRDIRKRS